MTNEPKLSPEEISKRITTGMGLVYDLFNEMNSLLRLIAQGLESSESDIRPFARAFMMPKEYKGATPADSYIKTDMGFMATIGGTELSELSEEDDNTEEDSDTDSGDKKKIQVNLNTQILGVRAILYDTQATADGDFQPTLVACVLSSFTLTPRGKKAKIQGAAATDSFETKRGNMRRLLKHVPPELSPKMQVTARIVGWELSAVVTAFERRLLAEFDSEEQVNGYIEKLIEMVENAEA
jgi:hypothetical protein